MILSGFYTSIDRMGDKILYRGWDENGIRVEQRIPYKPTIYLEAKPASRSEWTALDGTRVDPLKLESLSEMRDFLKTYEGVSSMKVYGNTKPIPSFIQSFFPEEIKFKRHLIDVGSLDI